MAELDFLLILTTCFTSSLCITLIIPLLPLELNKYEFSETVFGYIFAIDPTLCMIGSLGVGKLMVLVGRKAILLIGVCTLGLCLALLSVISYTTDTTVILILCFLSRACQGLATSMVQTTSFAIISKIFEERKQKYFAYLEGSQGLGLVLGPVVGGLLYMSIGFSSTFYVLGGFLIMIFLILYFKLPRTVNDTENPLLEQTVQRSDQESTRVSRDVIRPVGYCDLLKNALFALSIISVTISTFQFAYYYPIIPLELSDFGLSDLEISLFTSLQPLGYLFCTLFILPLCSKLFSNIKMVACTLLLGGVSHLLVGPSVPLPHSLTLMIIAQLLVGVILIFLMIPSFVLMIESAEVRFPAHKSYVNDLSSGMFNFCGKFGQTFGAIYGSHLSKIIGFRNVCTTVSIAILLFSIVYICHLLRINRKNKSLPSSQPNGPKLYKRDHSNSQHITVQSLAS
ncbi:unnamed protein product [Moneuplotes crassus]|uniref:Major facilitator superfamily (MFS) profile domain-containing protein n=1 Tax=Euplotes crassus TaxID=5936 RepID=A0AAD1UQQ9_EUPCR|nr:unnamed protein product [Moneuplotes crassus]